MAVDLETAKDREPVVSSAPRASERLAQGASFAAKSSVTSSAAVFAAGVLCSRLLGLLRDMMTARFLPIDVRDAFFVAFRLPNIFRRVFGEGALSASVTPVMISILTTRPSELQSGEADPRLRRLIAGVFSLLLSVTIVISLLAILFMEPILGLLLSGHQYQMVPGKFELTVLLARIMFSFLVLVSVYAYFMALLHSVRKFALAAFAPCLFNLTMIFAARVSSRFLDATLVLAWAVMAGGVLQLLVLIPALVKNGLWPRLSFRWGSPEVLSVVKTVIPGLFGLSVMQLSTVVNLHFASGLASGSQTYLYLADRLLELPLSLFVVSLGSALLPTLASQWAANAKKEMGETVNHYVRLILFVSLPAAVGLLLLAQPITEVLFLGREFKFQDAVLTAQVMQIYSMGIILLAGVRILAQGFYAIRSAWFPALAAGVALFSHVVLAWALTKAFGLMGLAAASVGSSFVNLMMLAAGYNSWVGSLEIKKLIRSLAKFSVGIAVMTGILFLYQPILTHYGSRYVRKSTVLFFIMAAGGLSYFAVAHALNVEEYHETLALFIARLRRGRRTTTDTPIS